MAWCVTRHRAVPAGTLDADRGGGLCADGYDVDPVDIFRLMLHTRLETAYQRLDLGAAEAIVDVDPGTQPIPAPDLRR